MYQFVTVAALKCAQMSTKWVRVTVSQNAFSNFFRIPLYARNLGFFHIQLFITLKFPRGGHYIRGGLLYHEKTLFRAYTANLKSCEFKCAPSATTKELQNKALI